MDPVVIVGAGLAGLSCARELTRAGIPVRVLEAGDAVGGRVRTDVVDGFRLDRGFQVLLTAYPTTAAAVDLGALRPRPLLSGANILLDGRIRRVGDPLRHPLRALSAARSPLTNARDARALTRLVARARGPLRNLFTAPETTTEDALHAAGVSHTLLNAFFRPFFGGVFLDRELSTTSRMFDFLFRMFAKGPAVVPELGMEEIPKALARRLPPRAVSTNTHVTAVNDATVSTDSGETVQAAAVVIATDGTTAHRLTAETNEPRWCETTTVYFAAARPPTIEPTLYLDGDGRGPVNNVVIMSNVSGAYAPADQALISASVVGPAPIGDALLQDRVREHLEQFFGAAAHDFRHLRSYAIRHALPAQPPGWLEPPARPVRVRPGLYVCGDHRENGSIEGAIVSGRRAAHACLLDTAP